MQSKWSAHYNKKPTKKQVQSATNSRDCMILGTFWRRTGGFARYFLFFSVFFWRWQLRIYRAICLFVLPIFVARLLRDSLDY
ncbi:hypothetical protein [Psychrobacter aestuarii]|uniref:hypothetical protein n=1 Tax=Psychrobacter aestuarii TaxID=556327 RepID=UPI001918301C|nr:hypothetical protein [Psychrobacter aestuarii]